MKRVLWALLLVLGIFVFRTDVLAADCGSVAGQPCCINDKGEFDCSKNAALTCIGDGAFPTCELVGVAEKNTCSCPSIYDNGAIQHDYDCNTASENYCDKSGADGGLKAFCRYSADKKCGKSIPGGSCACMKQADASKDQATNGYNRYHAPGTCVLGSKGSWYPKYYIVKARDYCGEPDKTKEARAYETYNGSMLLDRYCKCVDKNLPAGIADPGRGPSGFLGGVDVTNKLIADPGTEYQGPNTILLKGSNVKMYCEDASGNMDKANPTVNTAFGCLPISVGGFVSWAVRYILGIVGGISFLMMVYGFILMSTSEGDPKKAQAAKDTITSAITGLVIAIFSIFLVRLIMLYVLKLPGVT